MRDDQPSATARLIARCLLLLSQDPARADLVPPRSAETSGWFLEACGEDPTRFRRFAGRPWFRRLLYRVEQSTTPGLWTHYALRKRHIEKAVREGLSAEARQVVVLGAGSDTLAWRLHREFPGAAFWEVDHPATQKVKRAALAAREPLGANLCFITLNLVSDHLSDALSSAPGFRSGAATVFVSEGLLMYLEAGRVSDVFQDAHGVGGPGSRFVFTFLEPQAGGCPGFSRRSRFVDGWLRRRGEPFRWGLGRAEAVGFLEERGWRLQETLLPSDLRRQCLAVEPPPSVVGDLIGLATWKDAA